MFESRSMEEEYIDSPQCEPQIVNRSHRFMRMVNRYLGGTGVVKAFVRRAAAEKGEGRLSILDIGSGTCDIAVAVARWARQRDIEVRFTCVEKRHEVCARGREAIARNGLANIAVVQGDIFEYEPEEMFDYAVGSMFFHHLTEAEIERLLVRLAKFVRNGVLINDLHRSFLNYAGCLLLWPVLGRDVLHDALVSIRKGFRRRELEDMLMRARYGGAVLRLHFWGRISARIDLASMRQQRALLEV
jgi:hypothetical protein